MGMDAVQLRQDGIYRNTSRKERLKWLLVVFCNNGRLFWIWKRIHYLLSFLNLVAWQKVGEWEKEKDTGHCMDQFIPVFSIIRLFTKLNKALDIALFRPTLALLKALKGLLYIFMKGISGYNCMGLCWSKRCRNCQLPPVSCSHAPAWPEALEYWVVLHWKNKQTKHENPTKQTKQNLLVH